jgi:hypothetical protein
MRSSLLRMRSSLVVRASDCQCTSCNGPGFDPSIRRHSGTWGAADETVLNIVRTKRKKSPQKNIYKKILIYLQCDETKSCLLPTGKKLPMKWFKRSRRFTTDYNLATQILAPANKNKQCAATREHLNARKRRHLLERTSFFFVDGQGFKHGLFNLCRWSCTYNERLNDSCLNISKWNGQYTYKQEMRKLFTVVSPGHLFIVFVKS